MRETMDKERERKRGRGRKYLVVCAYTRKKNEHLYVHV